MTITASEAAGGLLRHRPFFFYFSGRGFTECASQIAAVAVGWQVYALTGSALDLGLVGLAQFLPMLLLMLIAGHAADAFDRRRVLQVCQAGAGAVGVFLAIGSFAGWLTVPEIFAAVALIGVFDAFESPAKSALLPGVTPEGLLQKGAALTTRAMQIASIGAPALGGFIYALAPGAPYTIAAFFWVCAALANGLIKLDRPVAIKAPPLDGLFDSVKFVRNNPAIFGTISLDLFAVLFGGATALLPSMRATFCTPGLGGLACCAARRLSAHLLWRPISPVIP